MIILVSGWRDHPDEHAVYNVLDAHWRAHPVDGGPFVVWHGACPTGADQYADTWATSRGVPVSRYPARDFGSWPWCGPRRNTAMVRDLAEANAHGCRHSALVVAFPQPDWETVRRCGTRDLITKARRAGFVPEIHVAPVLVGGTP